MPDLVGNLLIVAATLCFLTYWALWSTRNTVSLAGALVKSGAVGFLALLSLTDVLTYSLYPALLDRLTSFPGLMALGLTFGALGDFALARRGDKAFLAGMAAFAIGHLLYAYALWRRTHTLISTDLSQHALATPQIAALLALAVLILSTEIWLAPKTAALRWPVRAYVLVIGLFATAAILLVPSAATTLLQAGALLFIASDLLLALRLFVATNHRWQTRLSLAVWPTYWLAQVLILVGAVAYGISVQG